MDSSYVKTFNYFDMTSMSKLKTNSDNKDEQLKVVAKQLESVFLELVLKTMHQADAALKSDLYNREQEDFYQQMFDQQLALTLAKSGGVGLADVIYKQLKGNVGDTQLEQAKIKQFKNTPTAAPTIQPSHSVEINVQPSLAVESTNESQQEIDITSTPSIESIQDFIHVLLPHAQYAAKMIGVDPKVLLAQAALETGWGKHILANRSGESSYNLFNVKADKKWEGEKVLASTVEFIENEAQKIKANFKAYSSYLDSFLDYANLLQHKRYEKALANVHDPKAYLTELHQAGYATDPKYVDKIMSIYEKFTKS